ncbi:hypothetical protein OIU79_024863 [Salix purpurea]|uniref:Uncharacterized protein n=1 Tax=Salix purpurea TaxID=77065 RepID=A0A9Q1A6B3_SALPP|nr:hypothetical protein OIU79_024863 [Salix purpurea]
MASFLWFSLQTLLFFPFIFSFIFYGFDVNLQNCCLPSPNFPGLASSVLSSVFFYFSKTSCLGLGLYRSVTSSEIKLVYSGLT